MLDPTAPAVYAPPRQVYEWTLVPGHEVRERRRSSDGVVVGVCSCGQQQTDDTPDWRGHHLAAAWPALVPREPDESVEAWRERLVAALAEARAEDERLSSDMGVNEGEPIPVISEAEIAASQRVEVLEHQLAEPPFREAL